MQPSPEHLAIAQQAFSLFQQGQFQKALELIETLLALPPLQPSLLNLAAVCARSLGIAGKAEPTWRSAIELDPGHTNAHANLGLVLQDTDALKRPKRRFTWRWGWTRMIRVP